LYKFKNKSIQTALNVTAYVCVVADNLQSKVSVLHSA